MNFELKKFGDDRTEAEVAEDKAKWHREIAQLRARYSEEEADYDINYIEMDELEQY